MLLRLIDSVFSIRIKKHLDKILVKNITNTHINIHMVNLVLECCRTLNIVRISRFGLCIKLSSWCKKKVSSDYSHWLLQFSSDQKDCYSQTRALTLQNYSSKPKIWQDIVFNDPHWFFYVSSKPNSFLIYICG